MRQWTINLLAAITIAIGGLYVFSPVPAMAQEAGCVFEDGWFIDTSTCTDEEGNSCTCEWSEWDGSFWGCECVLVVE